MNKNQMTKIEVEDIDLSLLSNRGLKNYIAIMS